MRRIRFHPAAAVEAEEAAVWYSTEQPGLGSQFGSALEEALAHLYQDVIPSTRYPHLPERINAQRLQVRRFPYDLVFLVGEEEIVIVAVAHHRRRPGYWRARMAT